MELYQRDRCAAGPLLLNLIVSYLSESNEGKQGSQCIEGHAHDRATWQSTKGYVFALLLGITSLLKVDNL